MHLIDRDRLLDDLINKVPKMAAITEATLPILICEQPVIKAIPITREQVEKMRGKLKSYLNGDYNDEVYYCSVCGHDLYELARSYDFCQYCGAPMTDEAVDILWKRLEAMQDV